ncbi:50S ribosomal protein L9 [Pseudomonadota bacterium]
MKVILTSKIRNLGSVGDVVIVKDGYGRNYLIPQGQAIIYSSINYEVFETKKQQFEEENKRKQAQAETYKKKLDNNYIILIESASEDGKLYGSISPSKLSSKINEIVGKDAVAKSQVFIKNPIKNTGYYNVTLMLHPEVIFGINVVAAASDQEAKLILKELKEPNKKEEVEKKTKPAVKEAEAVKEVKVKEELSKKKKDQQAVPKETKKEAKKEKDTKKVVKPKQEEKTKKSKKSKKESKKGK